MKYKAWFVLLIILGPVLSTAAESKILLAAATDAELQPLLAKMSGIQTESRSVWTFWTGTLEGKDVVLARTEGDPLNAVAATTLWQSGIIRPPVSSPSVWPAPTIPACRRVMWWSAKNLRRSTGCIPMSPLQPAAATP